MKARSLVPLVLVLAACDGPPLIGWTAPTAENLVGEWELVDDGGEGVPLTLFRFTQSGEAALIVEDGNPELAPTFVGPLSGDSLILVRPELEATPDPRQGLYPRVKVSRDGEWLELMVYDFSGTIRGADTMVMRRWFPLTYRRR